ncbi:hypothetical protein [Catenovulum adriaticum]|uniref:Uncharacterized protein n=1 Tax=Catenovulum adriaticum TaxID=2984846 RepID=A0ABY7AQI6_9ALTE|nr:hypothetical protein [Catenovulum sp. TS8]WAJ71818.1 hypothetical protein OLW01_15890 [Catenovulum sp. TS8]
MNKGKQKTGISNALMSHVNLYASLANLVGYKLDKTEAIDSENILASLIDADAPTKTERN